MYNDQLSHGVIRERLAEIFAGQFAHNAIPFPQRRFPENFTLQSRVTQFVNAISLNVHYNENNSYTALNVLSNLYIYVRTKCNIRVSTSRKRFHTRITCAHWPPAI